MNNLTLKMTDHYILFPVTAVNGNEIPYAFRMGLQWYFSSVFQKWKAPIPLLAICCGIDVNTITSTEHRNNLL